MISKLGSSPFLRRQQAESEAGEAGKKAAVGKALPRPPAGAPTATKSVVVGDHFERATGGLFATAFARPAHGAPAHERTVPGRVDLAFADGANEPFLDAAALTGGSRSSELRALAEQLKQLTAEKKALREAMSDVIRQIQEVENAMAEEGKSAGFDLVAFLTGGNGGAPADPRLAELMTTLGQLRDRLVVVDEQIADLVDQIQEMGEEPNQEVRVKEDLPHDLRGETGQAGEQQIASARHLRHAVSFDDPDP